jgi:hypothetical protein
MNQLNFFRKKVLSKLDFRFRLVFNFFIFIDMNKNQFLVQKLYKKLKYSHTIKDDINQ